MLDKEGKPITASLYSAVDSGGAQAILTACEMELARLTVLKSSRQRIETIRDLYKQALSAVDTISYYEKAERERRETEGLTEEQLTAGEKQNG